MTGRLFVVRGDLTQLACDAVLVPSSQQLQVTRPWTGVVPVRRGPDGAGWYRVDVEAPQGWGEDDRCLRLAVRSLDREVWLVRTDAWGRNGTWVADGMVQAVHRAASGLRDATQRARPLIGVPLAGTGDGGMERRRGEVVEALVPALERAAAAADVDVVLVLRDGRDHAAVQARRSWEAGVAQVEEADRLGELASRGALALFLGAGVSIAAGLPSWSRLIELLSALPGLDGVPLAHLGPTDAAQAARAALGADVLERFLVEKFTLTRHALAHALLAGLEVESAITTNYDAGYELAAGAVLPRKHPLRLLPYEEAAPGRPWLLKLHGDVAHAGTMVLTRDDYLDYAYTRAPLSGLVQGVMLTRHVLFVGFSLQDEHFARLAHQVRRLLKETSHDDRKVGTVVALRADPARGLLWQEDLFQVEMAPASVDESQEAKAVAERDAARSLEVFLDRLSWRATTLRSGDERYLLDQRYDAIARREEEQDLRKRLRQLAEEAGPGLKRTRAWAEVERALRRLGHGRA